MTALHTEPFGTYTPCLWQRALMAVTQRLPPTWLGRRLGLWLRKPVIVALGQSPVDVTRLGFRARLWAHDNVSERRVLFTPQFFDHEELVLLQQRIQSGYRFLDVGANAGFYALFVAARAGAEATIVAVEPQPIMLSRLRTNIELNGFSSIRVAPVALAGHDGDIELHLSADNRGQASLAVNNGEKVIVPCRTLLSLMNEHNILQADAMKIDIEGAEDIVLTGFFKTAPRERWPRLVFIERNGPRWQTDAVALMRDLGYRELSPGRMNAILELA